MLWGKKEGKIDKSDKSTLPDLPVSRQMTVPSPFGNEQNHENENEESVGNRLPSYPDSPIKRGFSQMAIKEAVDDKPNENNLPELPSYNENVKEDVEESENEWEPSGSMIKESPPEREREFMRREAPMVRSVEVVSVNARDKDIFVKIDKFQAAKKTLSNVRIKVEEVESLLKKIRDAKLKEERELSYWENELANIKSKIISVREDIFEKV